MKTIKLFVTAACIAALMATNSQAFLGRTVITIPIIMEPLIGVSLPWFWGALAAVGVVMEVSEELCEPLENHKVFLQHATGSTSATISWIDGEYPTRDIDAERVFNKDPMTEVETWWIKSTFTHFPLDSAPITEVTYSRLPPEVNDFCMMDVHYNRVGMPGNHESSFSYDAFEVLTMCCKKLNYTKPFPLPVMAITSGWNWTPLWRNDIMYRSPSTPYEDRHYLLLGPFAGSYALYKPQDGSPNAEVNSVGVSTLYGTP